MGLLRNKKSFTNLVIGPMLKNRLPDFKYQHYSTCLSEKKFLSLTLNEIFSCHQTKYLWLNRTPEKQFCCILRHITAHCT